MQAGFRPLQRDILTIKGNQLQRSVIKGGSRMTIRIFNGFSCDARWPSKLNTGLVCTLVETDQGLVLIDTGPGLEDYAKPHWMMNLFQVITRVIFDPQEAAVNQVRRLATTPKTSDISSLPICISIIVEAYRIFLGHRWMFIVVNLMPLQCKHITGPIWHIIPAT